MTLNSQTGAASSAAREDAGTAVAVADGPSLANLKGDGVGRSRFLQLPRLVKEPGERAFLVTAGFSAANRPVAFIQPTQHIDVVVC